MYAATSIGSIRQASASATANASAGDGERANENLQWTAGSGDQQSALGPLLEKFPLPGGGYIPPSEVAAMRWAYDTKIANAVSGLCLAHGALAKAMFLLETITKKRTLVQCWTVDNAGEVATDLDNLLRELAVCCERIAKDILTMRGS